jgi:Fe-S cluster biogenesis protein NfuA/nitrite reductase/ring-hydroxylating ferredoxin subunit
MSKPTEIQARLKSIEDLVYKIEQVKDPALKATAKELVRLLMEFHGQGIERMLEIVHDAGGSDGSTIDALSRDEHVRSLLLLYGLHPEPLETRILQGLEKARPYLKSHGGNVELVAVDDTGAVTLRLEGSCQSCPSSSATLKLAVEEAIYEAAPDVTAIHVEGVQEELAAAPIAGFVPLSELEGNGKKHEAAKARDEVGWEDVLGLDAILPGALRAEQVAGRDILFCRLEETLYAYSNTCPGCGQPLAGGGLTGSVLACPICSQHYDVVHAGRGVDLDSIHLEPVPLLRENGRVKVALPLSKAQRNGL